MGHIFIYSANIIAVYCDAALKNVHVEVVRLFLQAIYPLLRFTKNGGCLRVVQLIDIVLFNGRFRTVVHTLPSSVSFAHLSPMLHVGHMASATSTLDTFSSFLSHFNPCL